MTLPLPPIHHQLDGSATAGEDCGPCADATALAFMARNRLTPDQHQLRRRMGPDDLKGPTNVQDAIDAWGTYLEEFTKVGLTRPVWRKLVPGSWSGDVMPALENVNSPRGVLLSISYEVFNRWDDQHPKPNMSGSPTFMGGHMIFVHGIATRNGERCTRLWDSLHDRRRPGIPFGPMWAPLALIRQAAAAYAERGDVIGAIVRRSAAVKETT